MSPGMCHTLHSELCVAGAGMSNTASRTCLCFQCADWNVAAGPPLSHDLSRRVARLLYVAAQGLREQKLKLPPS